MENSTFVSWSSDAVPAPVAFTPWVQAPPMEKGTQVPVFGETNFPGGMVIRSDSFEDENSGHRRAEVLLRSPSDGSEVMSCWDEDTHGGWCCSSFREVQPSWIVALTFLTGKEELAIDKVAEVIRRNGVTLMEHPDARKHPSCHPRIADEMLETARRSNYPIVVRTHSQMMIERMRGQLSRGKWQQSEVEVVWVSSQGFAVLSPRKDGSFEEEWPEGYFTEQLDEVLGRNP